MIDWIPRGTIIKAIGITVKVKTLIQCQIYYDYADIEFKDENDNYRHYKSDFDKGYIVFPNGVKIIYDEVK